MVIKKILLFVLAISVFSVSGNALERKKPLPLKELQNPNGPSYVPIPYPKTRNEIIKDLKYAINLHHGPIDGNNLSYGDRKILKLLKVNSDIKVAEIEKVKNRVAEFSEEYFLLIMIKDKKGNEVARIALGDNGLYVGANIAPQKGFSKPLKNKVEALKDFSTFTNIFEKIKIERVFIASHQISPYPFAPTWELVTPDNSKYYLGINYSIYKLRKVMDWNQGESFSPAHGEYIFFKDEIIVRDSLNDKLLFLDKLR